MRKLLRFSVLAANRGTADLVVGIPDTSTLNPDGSVPVRLETVQPPS